MRAFFGAQKWDGSSLIAPSPAKQGRQPVRQQGYQLMLLSHQLELVLPYWLLHCHAASFRLSATRTVVLTIAYAQNAMRCCESTWRSGTGTRRSRQMVRCRFDRRTSNGYAYLAVRPSEQQERLFQQLIYASVLAAVAVAVAVKLGTYSMYSCSSERALRERCCESIVVAKSHSRAPVLQKLSQCAILLGFLLPPQSLCVQNQGTHKAQADVVTETNDSAITRFNAIAPHQMLAQHDDVFHTRHYGMQSSGRLYDYQHYHNQVPRSTAIRSTTKLTL